MIATILMMGPKYECKYYNNRDWIWLQSSLQIGPNMIAMLVTKGTEYECNLNSELGYIWLQSLPEKDHSHVTLGRSTTLQSYKVLSEKDCIYGPIRNRLHHIKSPLWPRLQPYFVFIVTLFAIIYGQLYKNYCNHEWSGLIWYYDFTGATFWFRRSWFHILPIIETVEYHYLSR